MGRNGRDKIRKIIATMQDRNVKEQYDELLKNVQTNLRVRSYISAFFIPGFALIKWLFDVPILWAIFPILGILFALSAIYYLLFLRWKVFKTLFTLSIASTLITIADLLILGSLLYVIGCFTFGAILALPLYIIYAYLVYPFRWQSYTVLAAVLLFFSATSFLEYFGTIPSFNITGVSVEANRNPSFFAVNILSTLGLLFFIGYYSRIFSDKLREKSAALLIERDRLDAVFENLPEGVVVFDEIRRFVYVNSVAANLLGYPFIAVSGKLFSDIAPREEAKTVFHLLSQWLERAWRGDAQEVAIGSRAPRTFRARGLEIKDPYRKTRVLSVIIFTDISRDTIINKMKSEFISLVAHQLRTPLSAMKWNLNFMLEGEYGSISDVQRGALEKELQQTERMIRIVNEVLDVVRIEEGSYEYHFVAQPLASVIHDVVVSFTGSAKRKGITLSVQWPPQPLPEARIDPERIRMVFENLIENAIAYTDSGGSVSLLVTSRDGMVEVVVQDTGIGIAADDMSRLFTKFFREKNAILKETEGHGLGLFLSKSIVEAHGGTITVSSNLGKGSSFVVTIPVA